MGNVGHILAVLCLGSLTVTNCARILVLLPLSTRSETNLYRPIAEALAARGHFITYVAPVPLSVNNSESLSIIPALTDTDFMPGEPLAQRELAKDKIRYMLSYDPQFITDKCHQVHQDPDFQTRVVGGTFDLILASGFFNECFLGLAGRHGVPLILASSMPVPHTTAEYTGLRMPTAFVPYPVLHYTDRMNFWDRMANGLTERLFTLLTKYLANPEMVRIYREYLGEETPDLNEILGTVSILFSNSDFALTRPRPMLPDMVEIGGLHCRPAKPLPKDLRDFIEGAEHGTIFFSLGSVIQAKNMPEHLRKIFLSVFSRLKQRVLWKWEAESMPDLPKNVKLGKWLPQQDILGNPNTKLFITHAGLFSSQEAVYHGVPILGVPFFVDQDVNILFAEQAGYANSVEILELTEDIFEAAVHRMLDNQSYTQNAKRMSRIVKDQLNHPLDRAVYWVEYVLRHKGAPHLRSAARDLNYFQYHSVDVIGFIGLVFIVVCGSLGYIVTWCFCSSSKNKQKVTSASKKTD